MSLKVNLKEKEPGIFMVVPVGEINSDTYRQLEEKVNPVLAGEPKAIVFDLKKVSYISSMGLSVLFKVKQALNEKGGAIMFINPQPQIKDVFETVKFMPDYMFASLEEADEYLDQYLDALQKGKIKPRKPKF